MQNQQGVNRCQQHRFSVVSICRSPRCDHYRELCEECQAADRKHAQDHLSWHEATQEALRVARLGLTGLQAIRARKNQEMDENINNNPGLFELQSKLDEICKLINMKLDEFRNNIKRVYSKHVREKLDELDEIIEKSQQFLQRQINQLEQRNYTNLHVFFKNDFLHEVKYFESYFNQIFVKKIRSFKTAIENDRIFSLLTNFEQSLEQIFTISKKTPLIDKMRESHLFTNEDGQCYLYTLAQNMRSLASQPIAAMNRISHSKLSLQENGKYVWNGCPQSVYYPQGSCYYIIGEGNKPSKLIVKYEYLKSADEAFTVVKSMQTQRQNFGVCLLNGEIYIVGGENSKEGCLVKCEKFVPLHNNQVYIIHSLRHRSSRHSITTYKEKYILKFGGIRRQSEEDQVNSEADYSSPSEIYSLKTEEWSVIPFQSKLQFNINPSIFKAQRRNFILILGGDSISEDYLKFRPAYQITLEESKGQIDQVKIRSRQSKIEFRDSIFNSTIALLDEDNECIFIKKRGDNAPQIGRYKIEL